MEIEEIEKLKIISNKVTDLDEYTNKVDKNKFKKDDKYKKEIHDSIVKKLQEINECFLQNVIIEINRLKIYPVEVEIYYYDNKGIFQDGNCHQNVLQENNFSNLYFHRAGRLKEKEALIDTTYHGGVDVCLSKGKYNLSILLRSAYIKNRKENKLEFITGIHRIVNRITDELENLLEKGKIDFEYDIYENEEIKKEQLKYEISKFTCEHRKRMQGEDSFAHEEIEKKNYDEYELNTYIDDEKITSKMIKPNKRD